MKLLESLSSFLDSSFSDVQKENPLEGKIKPAPVEEKIDNSVMAPLVSKEGIKSEPVRSFPEELLFVAKELWNSATDPSKVIPWLAEQAVNPLSYLSPPAKALGAASAGAGIIGALTKWGMLKPSIPADLANQVGAFRPSNSKLLPSSLAGLKEVFGWDNPKPKNVGKQGIADFTLSNKEIAKYGTPEFLLDKYLPSSSLEDKGLDKLAIKEISLQDFLHSTSMGRLETAVQRIGMRADVPKIVDRNLSYIRDLVDNTEPDLRAFRDQITDRKPIYKLDFPVAASNDINDGIRNVIELLKEGQVPNLTGKSLTQLIAKADEVYKKKSNDLQVMIDFTKQRSIYLNKSQNLPPGFVELTTPQDFSADTQFLNNCVGAAGMSPEGKYKPAFHPVTGDQLIFGRALADSSFQQYQSKLQQGLSRFFSYRPEGLPELTIEIDPIYGSIKQVTGLNNRDVTIQENKLVKEHMSRLFQPQREAEIKRRDDQMQEMLRRHQGPIPPPDPAFDAEWGDQI